MRTHFLLAMIATLSFALISRAGYNGVTAYPAAPASDGQTNYAAASDPGYREEIRTTLRTVTETVMQNVQETIQKPITTTVMREEKSVSYKPVYETVNDVKIETVLKPVTEVTMKECTYTVYRKVSETNYRICTYTVCKPVTQTQIKPQCFQVFKPVCETTVKDCCYTVTKPVTETVLKDVCKTICKPVTETIVKEVCRTEMRCVCESGTKEVCKTVYEPVIEMKCVTKRVPVTECQTSSVKGGVTLGQADSCGTCRDCGQGNLCERVHCRWQAFGDCLGNCGAKIGERIVNGGPVVQCLFIRMPDRIACRLVTRTEVVTEQVPVTKWVLKRVTESVPTSTTKKMPVEVIEKVPVTATKFVSETVIEKVPVTVTKTITVNEVKKVPTTVRRVAQGAYVDRASITGQDADGLILGPAAAGSVKPNAATFESGGEGRVFVEGLSVTRNVAETTTTMQNVTETRRIPETVTRTIPETLTKLVPTSTTKMVPTECRTVVPRLVAKLERVECTKLVPVEVTTYETCVITKRVPVCVTKQVPSTCIVKVPCTDCACSAGHHFSDACRQNDCGSPKPVREFLARLYHGRFCCEPCAASCGCAEVAPATKPAAPAPVESIAPMTLPGTK